LKDTSLFKQKSELVPAQTNIRGLSQFCPRPLRAKFSQLKEQARENILTAQNNLAGAAFLNSGKLLTPVNTTQTLADELKTSTDTASRIIQIQAKADEPTKAEKRMKAGVKVEDDPTSKMTEGSKGESVDLAAQELKTNRKYVKDVKEMKAGINQYSSPTQKFAEGSKGLVCVSNRIVKQDS
jgi:hypothetical protein